MRVTFYYVVIIFVKKVEKTGKNQLLYKLSFLSLCNWTDLERNDEFYAMILIRWGKRSCLLFSSLVACLCLYPLFSVFLLSSVLKLLFFWAMEIEMSILCHLDSPMPINDLAYLAKTGWKSCACGQGSWSLNCSLHGWLWFYGRVATVADWSSISLCSWLVLFMLIGIVTIAAVNHQNPLVLMPCIPLSVFCFKAFALVTTHLLFILIWTARFHC